MKYNPAIHHRRSIRLKGYDYSQQGAYFITVCTQNRECLFGNIKQGNMILNDAGKMVQNVWDEIPKYYDGIETDMFRIMPNHIHGIIAIVGAGPRACPKPTRACPDKFNGQHFENAEPHFGKGLEKGQRLGKGQPQGVAPTSKTKLSLSDIVHRFKTLTTKKYIDCVEQYNWPSFDKRLWQRNFYEHIIRSEHELIRIREYITNNPGEWNSDRNNPENLDRDIDRETEEWG